MDNYIKANAALSKFSRNYMELKKGLPIRPSEMGVLNIISQTEGQYTPVKLAQLLGVSKPMITAHITSLVSKGYVTKEPSASDKRAYYIKPTDKALELVKAFRAEMVCQLDRLIGGMGQGDFDTLVALTEKANKILEESQGEAI